MDAQHPQLRPRLLLTAALVTLGLAAQADVIHTPLLKNVTDNLVVFDDDFESYTVPTSPTALKVPKTGAPVVGTWTEAPTGYVGTFGVVNTARSASGTVVPYEGNQFFMQSFTSGGRAFTGMGDLANSGTGDTIEMNIAFNLVSGSQRAFVYLYGPSTVNDLCMALDLNGTYPGHTNYTLYNHNGTAFQPTSLSFNPGAWNTMKVVHTNGTNLWDVSINGVTLTGLTGYKNTTAIQWTGINLNQTATSTVYFDAVGVVPEPATLAGLLLGGAVLAGARRKRQ